MYPIVEAILISNLDGTVALSDENLAVRSDPHLGHSSTIVLL
jgi:hypothetical protein